MATKVTRLIGVALLVLISSTTIWAGQWSSPQVLTELNDGSNYAAQPCLSPDKLTIYFTRYIPGLGHICIVEAYRDTPDGPFTSERVASELSTTGYLLGDPWISQDELRLYYKEYNGTFSEIKMATRTAKGNPWTPTKTFSELHVGDTPGSAPSLTADELVIFFHSSRPGSAGGLDLWTASRLNPNDAFTNLRPLDEINLVDNDVKPCILPDGLTLYYTSQEVALTKNEFFKATRATRNDLFGNIQMLNLPGECPPYKNHCFVTPDEKTLFYEHLTHPYDQGISVLYWLPSPVSLEQTKLLPGDGCADDKFGREVSIDGDYAIIGAPKDDDNGTDSGSAYIFQRNDSNWIEHDKLIPSVGYSGGNFGRSVAIEGDFAVVGAWRADVNGIDSGSAYIFQRVGSDWVQVQQLMASDNADGDNFGVGVAISGDYVIVGAHLDDDKGGCSGSAYIFQRSGSNWVEQAKLVPSDGGDHDYFGAFVSISGDYVIIGAYEDDDNGSNSGSAYIFKRNGNDWVEQEKLLPADGASNDSFGSTVSINGDLAIVGAYGDDDNGVDSGSAYIFQRIGDDWIEQDKLTPTDGDSDDWFGTSVAIDGDKAIVGAPYDEDNGTDSGSAYIFQRSGSNWIEQYKLTSYDGYAGDEFGLSVGLNGNLTIVGARSDSDYGPLSGSAYVTVLSWQPTTYHVDTVNGSDSNNGLSHTEALATITKGIELAKEGDTILVWPGLYDEEVDFSGKAITIKSADYPATIQAPTVYDDAVLYVYEEGPESVLENFIIQNSDTALLFAASSPTIRNITVVNNYTGAKCYAGATPDISSSIFWDNADDLDNCTARYSCIEDGDPGQGNISTNPLFADSNYHLLSQRGRYVLDKDYWISDKDYWILDETTSPCVDAGDPTIYPENEATPNGARVNMGAFGNTAYASLSEWPLSADINRDGTVNLLDFALFAQDFLWTAPWYE